MLFIKSESKEWASEPGYRRGVLLPFDNNIDGDIQIQVVEVEPGDEVSAHYHLRQKEYIYALEGSCKFKVNEKELRVKPGDLVITEPYNNHVVTNDGESKCSFLVVKYGGKQDDTVWDSYRGH
jgi:quercetin dioxygenase-like cupin family protein